MGNEHETEKPLEITAEMFRKIQDAGKKSRRSKGPTDAEKKEAARKAAALLPVIDYAALARIMCFEKVDAGFCTKPVCHFQHDEAVFAAMQEENGFCIVDAAGKICEAGAQFCDKTHNPEARRKIQEGNGMCENEIVYQCNDGANICKYNHDPVKVEEIRNKTSKAREEVVKHYKREQYKNLQRKKYIDEAVKQKDEIETKDWERLKKMQDETEKRGPIVKPFQFTVLQEQT